MAHLISFPCPLSAYLLNINSHNGDTLTTQQHTMPLLLSSISRYTCIQPLRTILHNLSSSSSFLYFLDIAKEIMMMGGGIQTLLHSSILVLSIIALVSCDDSPMQAKCSQEFTKLANCIDYSTGRADVPSGQCCTAVSGIWASVPECLCYIIQQTHKGLPALKQLGLQFSRLVQLSSACNLADASISNCPKLLNLPPNSPDNAIFTNSTKDTSTSSGSATVASASDAVIPKAWLASIFTTMIFTAIFLSVFSRA